MFDEWEWLIVPLVVIVFAVVAIAVIVIWLTHHPLVAGVLIGLIAGISGTLGWYWFRNHEITIGKGGIKVKSLKSPEK
jgi:hypothetical protein